MWYLNLHISKLKHLTQTMDIINSVNFGIAFSNNLTKKYLIIWVLFLYHFNNWWCGAVDQTDGKSVKLSNKIMVSSWMGDTMVCLYSSWIFFFQVEFLR